MLRTLKLVFRSRKFHGWPSQRSLHSAPIFRLLLKVAVNGTHQCDSHNFWGAPSSIEQRTNCCTIFGELRAPTNREPIAAGGARSVMGCGSGNKSARVCNLPHHVILFGRRPAWIQQHFAVLDAVQVVMQHVWPSVSGRVEG